MDGTTSGFYDTCEKMHATPLRPRHDAAGPVSCQSIRYVLIGF